MSLKNITKEELELLSNKDITDIILQESKKSMNTADLFKKIIEVLELPQSCFENKIADYYTSLATDKRFILLEDGTWDLRSHHTSDKIAKITEEDDEEDEEDEEENKEDLDSSIEEDSYDDTDDDDYNDDTSEELKDLVVIDEDELELEQ